ncbi:MAG: phosphoribosyltransferase [Tepidiformaceae bacterium]
MTDDDLRQRIVGAVTFPGGHADVWAIFLDAALFHEVVTALADPFRGRVQKVVGIEARGFILGAAVAIELEAGFVAIRKPGGLLPGGKHAKLGAADYRGNTWEMRMQRAAVRPGEAVLLVDDWVETGSQAAAARSLIESSGGIFAGIAAIVDQTPVGWTAGHPASHFLIPAGELRG